MKLWVGKTLLLVGVFAVAGCSGAGDANKHHDDISKKMLHDYKADGVDICAQYDLEPGCDPCLELGFYEDGACDADLISVGVCPGPDPDCVDCTSDADCGVNQQCIVDCIPGGACDTHCQDTGEIEGCQSDADCEPIQVCVVAGGIPPYPPVGTCVDTDRGCQSNEDCAPNEVCDSYCGNGWCQGICKPVDPGCESDADCGANQTCQVYCGNGWCHGDCVDNPIAGCETDDDCENGDHCVVNCSSDAGCVGMCIGTGLASECDTPADCAPNEVCNTYCGNGWCSGVCEPVDAGCGSDADCGENQICQVYCGNGWCHGDCVDNPVAGCESDADCGDGEYCIVECIPGGECTGNGICIGGTDDSCDTDADCVEGQTCNIYCGNGWCEGTCG